ncbi:hypothetical protein [Mesoterricola sediminis]|uniref:Semialdehyde dehydrogenase NAD-binding domain-containing protein n=1 Tax=Mesoterricola sediminis TaxID=2927980 RepID=A0AA48KE26_9BACT|nr:hypothetical protein [Mesoterricola sediminis]BDU75053.1 hypothetical protein METESE_00110 [Mesoterricola sediminis]
MQKIAVLGAGSLLGRELVETLEAKDCSVLPLTTGPTTLDEELSDTVMFAPQPELLEEIELVILAETPASPDLLADFTGAILDLRPDADPALPLLPVLGRWPEGTKAFRNRPAVDQVLALLPRLVSGLGDVAGTHLRSVAFLGDQGLDGLMEQTVAILKGEDPDIEKLGYRAAFEVVPQVPRGRLLEIRVPAFHGDLLVLHLTAAPGAVLAPLAAPEGVQWTDHPATSREVAVSPHLLAHLNLADEGRAGILTLGFDPILWGTLMPVLRLLGL